MFPKFTQPSVLPLPPSFNQPSILDLAIDSLHRKDNNPFLKSGKTISLPYNIFPSEDVKLQRQRSDPHVNTYRYVLQTKDFEETDSVKIAWNKLMNELRLKVKKSMMVFILQMELKIVNEERKAVDPLLKDFTTTKEVDNFFRSEWNNWIRKIYFKVH